MLLYGGAQVAARHRQADLIDAVAMAYLGSRSDKGYKAKTALVRALREQE